MIFFYIPFIFILLAFIKLLKFSIIFSLLLTPILYFILSGILIYNNSYNTFHYTLENIQIVNYIENKLSIIISNVIGFLTTRKRVNNICLFIKVKIFVYTFDIIANLMTPKKDLTLEQNFEDDYLEILRRNRKKKLNIKNENLEINKDNSNIISENNQKEEVKI